MSEKRVIYKFLVLCLLLFNINSVFAQKVRTVVLDAGHGGHDTGALGKNSREKDITLAIVLKLRDYIQENLKDVKVILTRDDDTFIELYRRAKIANENKADLFISIHCNSTKSTSAFGVETFVMGLHKSDANLAVAKAENAAILLEEDYVEQYDGFDPNSPEGNIFFSMMQNAFLDRSLAFAGKVQHQLVDNLHKLNRGVKQAGFLVLYKTAMPGVLIETGFISNPDDEKYLLSEKGQSQIALAVFNSLKEFSNSGESKTVDLKNEDTLLFAMQPENGKTAKPGLQVSNTTIKTVKPDPNSQKDRKPEASGSKVIIQDQKSKDKDPKAEVNRVSYRVQFAMYDDDRPVNSKTFEGVKNVKMYLHAGSYKYTSGDFDSLDEALEWRSHMIKKGYKDSFVVAFKGKARITIEEANTLTEKK